MMGQDQDDVVVAPYTTVMRLLKRTIKIDAVLVSAIFPDAIDQAAGRNRGPAAPAAPDPGRPGLR